MENNPTMSWEILKNKVIQGEESNMKESQRYNVLVLINHHQDEEKMSWSAIRSPMDAKQNTKQNKGGDYVYRKMGRRVNCLTNKSAFKNIMWLCKVVM